MSGRLDWGDRDAALEWWGALCDALEDLSSVADDSTRPLGKRHLGRASARRLYREADRTLRRLISYGEPPGAEVGEPERREPR